jgi:dTDP-4-dehydrorhamnose reductase
MRIVTTGASGMLGHNLMRLARPDYEMWGGFHTHRIDIPGCRMIPLDLADGPQSRAQLKSIHPDVVIHTAALTDVDECERDPERAQRINADATAMLAEVTEDLGARFVYISTDYVFDGEKGDYSEQDSPSPVNRYGETKLLGEGWVRQRCSRGLILRTTLYGLKMPPRRGMIESLIDSLHGSQTVTRFADQFFTPVYTGQLSALILRLVDLGVLGLFHVGAAQKISRLAFARHVADVFAPGASILPIPFKQIEGIARRPRDSSLVSRCLAEQLDIRLPHLAEGLRQLEQDRQQLVEEREQ